MVANASAEWAANGSALDDTTRGAAAAGRFGFEPLTTGMRMRVEPTRDADHAQLVEQVREERAAPLLRVERTGSIRLDAVACGRSRARAADHRIRKMGADGFVAGCDLRCA